MKKNYIFLLVVIIIFSAFPRVARGGGCTTSGCSDSQCNANCSPRSGVCRDYGTCTDTVKHVVQESRVVRTCGWEWGGWRPVYKCTSKTVTEPVTYYTHPVYREIRCFCTDINTGNCGQWGSWVNCHPEAGKWYETRFCWESINRSIYQIRQCVALSQGDTSNGNGNGKPPPPPCVPSWGECSVSCGGGTQSDGCGNTRACNTQQCPPTITDFYIAKSLINMDHNVTETMNQETHIPFYIVLAMQMHLRTLPINWQVLDLGTGTCTASCTYVDKQGTRLQDGAGQPDDCQFRGNVGATAVLHNAFQVQPQHQGIVTYTLKCSNAQGSDTKTFQVGVKLFSWREVLRGIYDSASQFTTDTQFGFASILDAIRMKLSSGR